MINPFQLIDLSKLHTSCDKCRFDGGWGPIRVCKFEKCYDS